MAVPLRDERRGPGPVRLQEAPPPARALRDPYAPFVRTERPKLFMDPRSAEMVKYAANAMPAARISFLNEVALLCERVSADVEQVRRGMGADTRLGYPFPFPGIGYGGSCFPEDVKALLATGRRREVDLDLLRPVEGTSQLPGRAQKPFGARTDDLPEATPPEMRWLRYQAIGRAGLEEPPGGR